jgi:3-phenylpropionate/trans-cinnamate dioxygenase ferredoxin subunit
MTSESTDVRPEPDVLAAVEQSIATLQNHPDAAVRDATGRLLAGIDAVHRAGLSHLVQALQGMAGDTLIRRLIADPAIRMLLMSYDLIAVDRRLQAEEAVDTVRGHLHDHGVDVEIQDVVGGVVYARLHVNRVEGKDAPPAAKIRADLETALREFLIGFQELELRDRAANAAPSAIVPLAVLRSAGRPVYQDAAAEEDVLEGTMRAAVLNETPVLLARVAGDVYAMRNQCGDSPLPLHMGSLEGPEILCPWHGCRYDVRSGRRLDGEERLQVLPVRVEQGRILVAVDVAGGRS